MVRIYVDQYINGWVYLGYIQCESLKQGIDVINTLEKELTSPTVGTIALRQDIRGLLVVNLNQGPVRLRIIA